MYLNKLFFIVIISLSLNYQAYAIIVSGVGEYEFSRNISQKKSCEKAQERALNDARRKVSDEKISSQQSKTCTASEFKNECELFSDTWSYIDTVVLKSEPKKINEEILDKGNYEVCEVKIEVDLEKFPTPDVNFDFSLKINQDKFIATPSEKTTEARLRITIEPDNDQEMFINIFHYEPHVFGRNVSRIYPRTYDQSNKISDTLSLPPKNTSYRVIFPGAVTDESVYEGILVISSKNNLEFNEFYTFAKLNNKLLSVSNNDVRIKREMYVVIKD